MQRVRVQVAVSGGAGKPTRYRGEDGADPPRGGWESPRGGAVFDNWGRTGEREGGRDGPGSMDLHIFHEPFVGRLKVLPQLQAQAPLSLHDFMDHGLLSQRIDENRPQYDDILRAVACRLEHGPRNKGGVILP